MTSGRDASSSSASAAGWGVGGCLLSGSLKGRYAHITMELVNFTYPGKDPTVKMRGRCREEISVLPDSTCGTTGWQQGRRLSRAIKLPLDQGDLHIDFQLRFGGVIVGFDQPRSRTLTCKRARTQICKFK